MSRAHLLVLTAVLTLVGLGVFAYKVTVLGFPLMPEAEAEVWTVQARFSIEAGRQPVKAVLQIPDGKPGYSILDENFVSRGYGLTLGEPETGNGREARWAIRQASGRQTLYYRAVVYSDDGRRLDDTPPPPTPPVLAEPFQTAFDGLVAEVRRESADTVTFTAAVLRRLHPQTTDETAELLMGPGRAAARRAQLAVQLLAAIGVPARVAYGLPLEERRSRARFRPWLEVYDEGRWLGFDPATGEEGWPEDYLVWWRGRRPLIQVQGAGNPEVQISVQSDAVTAMEVAERRAEIRQSRLVEFSLLGLPIQTQAVYGVMLLIPIGALIMVLLRNVVGIKTFGTFTPILVALAFRETRLLWGIVLFTLVVSLGLGLRFYLERLRLLLVPRLAAVLTLVVLMMAVISVLSHKLGLETGLSVALFPLVILTMAIERLSIVWEERGAAEAVQEALGSLLVAAVSYLVMSLDVVDHMVFIFPELLLVLLAMTLLLGRYRGFRLLELRRFRALSKP
jgi:hypothetical protein